MAAKKKSPVEKIIEDAERTDIPLDKLITFLLPGEAVKKLANKKISVKKSQRMCGFRAGFEGDKPKIYHFTIPNDIYINGKKAGQLDFDVENKEVSLEGYISLNGKKYNFENTHHHPLMHYVNDKTGIGNDTIDKKLLAEGYKKVPIEGFTGEEHGKRELINRLLTANEDFIVLPSHIAFASRFRSIAKGEYPPKLTKDSGSHSKQEIGHVVYYKPKKK